MSTKKAFFVEMEEDGRGEVVWLFNKTDLDLTLDGCYSITRVPEFDQFYQQRWIPAVDWLNWGGLLECPECYTCISSDLYGYDKDTPLQPVYIEDKVYCSHNCRNLALQKHQKTKKYREGLLEECAKHIPDCLKPIIDSYFYINTSSKIELVSNELKFEGRVYWDADKPKELILEVRDVDRYKEWETKYLATK